MADIESSKVLNSSVKNKKFSQILLIFSFEPIYGLLFLMKHKRRNSEDCAGQSFPMNEDKHLQATKRPDTTLEDTSFG